MANLVAPERIAQLVARKDVVTLEATLLELAAGNCKPAIVALIEINTPKAWDAIGRFLATKQTAAVSFTIADLEEVVSPGAARALGASLSNPSPPIRRATVRALARQKTGLALPHLVRASRDPDPETQRIAKATVVQKMDGDVQELAEVPERALEGVFDLLDPRRPYTMVDDDVPANVRTVALDRVGRVGDAEAAEILTSALVHAEGREAQVCWAGLRNCKSLSEAQLLPLLTHPSPDVNREAIEIFARFATREDSGIFAAMTRAPDASVRAAALPGLAKLLGADAIDPLSVSLHDTAEIRLIAIDLLGEISQSTPQILAAVDHRDPEVRKRAMIFLAARGMITDELMPRYFEFLEGGSTCTDQSDSRYIESLATVARALAGGGYPEGLLPLARLARSSLRRLRRAAIESIMTYGPDLRADALDDLSDTYDRDVLKNVAMGLWEIRDKRAMIPMIRVSKECRGRPVRDAKLALREMEELAQTAMVLSLLTRKFASVRRFAAEKLIEMRDPESIPALLNASRDEDVEVQLAVFEALSPFAAEYPDVVKRMLEAVGYGDVSVRQAACEALGEARCREAVPQLVKALYNCFLRPRATQALKVIGDRMGMLEIKRLERRQKLFRKRPPTPAEIAAAKHKHGPRRKAA